MTAESPLKKARKSPTRRCQTCEEWEPRRGDRYTAETGQCDLRKREGDPIHFTHVDFFCPRYERTTDIA